VSVRSAGSPRDTSAVAARVTSTAFVGRAPELAELEAAFRDAAAGRPSLAFVAGESGVGKSRLLAELDARVTAAGALVLAGDCVELGAGELPYAPIVAALRPLVRDGGADALARLPPALRAELAAVVPGLGAIPASRAAPGSEPPGAAQGRLFEALLALVGELATRAPLVLVVEDLHWADSSTRAFLAFLARSLCRERLLLVASYRADELHRRHPLRPLLAELEREPRARRIELRRLTRPELAAQLEGILGAAPPDDLVARLWLRSEGNPLFTEELLAAGLDGRGALPPTLRDALMVRTERLPAAAQDVVRLLAVGRRLDHELLAAAGGLQPAALRDALREAVAAHVLGASADGTYAFRHALLREVVDDDLLPGERAHLHLTLARAMEARAADGPAGAHLAAGIAHHYDEAGDRPAALVAAVRAAEAADRVHAQAEAARLLEHALELWDQVPGAEDLTGRGRVDVLVGAARAHSATNEPGRAEALLRAALDRVDGAAEPERAAAIMERLARAQWSLGRQAVSLRTATSALELLPGEEPTAARAALQSWEARAYMLMGRYRRALTRAAEALATSCAAGDRLSEGRALNARGVAAMALGDADGGAAALRSAMAIAEELELPEELGVAHVNLADGLHHAGRSLEAIAVARAGIARTEGEGQRRVWQRLMLAEILLDTGAWDEAEQLLPPPERRPQGTMLLFALLSRAGLALARGREEEAARTLEDAAVLAADNLEPQFTGPLGAMDAERHRRAGDLAAAGAAVDLALDRIVCCTDDSTRVARVAAVGVDIQADVAQRARDRGDAQEAAAAAARAEGLMAFVAAAADEAPGRLLEEAYRTGARADLARAHGADDPAAWRAAREAWTALGRPHVSAHAALREAEARVAAGDREGAHGPLAAAAATARDLGAAWLAHEAHGLAARARLRLDPQAVAGVPGEDDDPSEAADAVAADPFSLTPRERQVLALLAEGATNREIGQHLFMAEKTASVHVSRILGKLGVRSRGQAAAVAHRLGLERTPA
jgi:DNA-binding NarL/FixJ family response regulator